MPSWRFGLQLRLIVGFAVILALSTGAVGLFTSLTAHREVAQIQAEQDRARAKRITVALADFYRANGGWTGAQEFIERVSFQTEREVVALDAGGSVVGDSRYLRDRRDGRGRRLKHNAPLPPPRHFTPVVSDNVQVGSVLVAPRGRGGVLAPISDDHDGTESQHAEPRLAGFAEAVNKSLRWSGLAAGAVGILLVLLLFRRALGSIGNLTAAARALGGGDLSSRVEVKGSDEIAELGHAFNAMADALEDSERQRRSMVSDVAHELRTPLTNIQGHIEALQDGLLEPDAATLETVHRQALYLTRLVNDLRLLAETEAKELQLVLEPESIADVVTQVASSFRPRAEGESVLLTAEVEDGLPLLNLDRLRIAQVMGNLVDNAIRHTPPGGTVTLSVFRHGDGVRVVAADSGAGIPAESLPHVFDRLYRVDPSRDRATGGAGLGLTIARQLVEAHGGTMWAESGAGQGSRFGFDLPASHDE